MIKKWKRVLVGGIFVAILVIVGFYDPTHARDVLYVQLTGEVLNAKPAGSDWPGIDPKHMVVTLELTSSLADSLTENPTLYKVDDVENPKNVLLSNRQTLIDYTVDEFQKDDILVTVRVPVYTDEAKRIMRPYIPRSIRELRRSDSVTYNYGESKTESTHCLIVMVVPKENEIEILKLINYAPDVELIIESTSLEFPKFEAIKIDTADRVTNEGK